MADDLKGAQQTVLAVIIVGVVLVIGIFILTQIGTTFDADNTVVFPSNATGGFSNQSGFQLPLVSGKTRSIDGFSIVQAYNATSGIALPAASTTGNLSVSSTGLVQNKTTYLFQALTINYTYTYSADTNSSIAADLSADALADGTPWLTILVVVAFAVIVLGYLMSGFSQNRSENKAVY